MDKRTKKVERDVRCSGKEVARAVPILDAEAKQILEDLKFHNMMKVEVETLKRRDIVEAIYGKTEVVDDKIQIHISDDNTIDVTIERIEEILGLPRNEEGESVQLPASAPSQVCNLFLKHGKVDKGGKSKPNLKNMRIGASDLINLMEKGDLDPTMKARLFLMIVLNRLLMPASGFHLNEQQVKLAWDLDCVKKLDWCKLVFEDLSGCIKDKHHEPKSFSGCAIVLLIAVFEALVPSQCPKTQPSILGYNNKTLVPLLRRVRSSLGLKKASDVSMEQNRSDDSLESGEAFPESEEEIHALMKEMAGHLNAVKHMVPTELHGAIQDTLETFDALTMRIWPLDLWDPFYEENVLNADIDSDDITTMVQIGDHEITKATFSKSLKPDGWMSSFVMDAQCEIWRLQWPDKIILTTFASKELVENNGTKSLDLELTRDKVEKATQIFVPVNVERVHWILVVMDFENKEVQILDSLLSNPCVAGFKVATNLELYLMTKLDKVTGFPKNSNLKVAKQTNSYDCGFHVLLYIQRYGCSDMYGIDTEQILCYRKQLAYELKQASNDLASSPKLYMAESPLRDLHQNETPSSSSSSSSTNSDSSSGPKPNAGNKDLNISRNEDDDQEKTSVLVGKRKRAKTDKTHVETPLVPQRCLPSEAADSLCKLVLNADPTKDRSNLITLNLLVMTIKECATFLTGGSATVEMIKECISLMVASDIKEKNIKKFRVMVGPMDMSTLDNDTGSEVFKDAVKSQVVPSIPVACKLVFFTVKKDSDWIVYCINKVRERIDYLICSSNEESMNAAELCHPLLKEVNFSGRRIFPFGNWSPTPVCFKEKISSSDTGLLAMYFMETYNGKEFSLEYENIKAWSESYRKIIFERIFNARGNSATVKKKLLVPKLPELVDGEEEGAPPQKSSQVMHDTAE